MMVPTGISPEELVAERDNYRHQLQLLIQEREAFTEAELAELRSVGVSFDSVTKQLQWIPNNGADIVAEWNAYHHAAITLMALPPWTLTRDDLDDMEMNGVTGEQLMAELDEMIREYHQERNGQ